MKKEQWKNISGYASFYKISNFGRVKSLKRFCKTKGGKQRLVSERLLKLFKIKGYYYVTLNKEGVMDQFRVNVLVGKTFIKNPKNLPVLNHKDTNKLNNNVTNLEWCTIQENNEHAKINGLIKGRKGENHHNCTLSEKDVLKIRLELEKNITGRKIAKKYGVSEGLISMIKHNKSWKK